MRAGIIRATCLVALLALLAACGSSERAGGHQPPRDGAAGLQLTGSFAGRQLALSDGAPSLLLGPGCQRRTGLPAELCFASRDIDGTEVAVVFLNPRVVQPGASLPVGGDCRSVEACAGVTDVAVVEVQVGDRRQRATSGQLSMRQVDPGSRYVGAATLDFREGALSGSFDVVPRPEL